MPEQLYRERSTFDHWLMHGSHPHDPSGFIVERLDQQKRELLVGLVASYLDAGFRDPGIGFLSGEERRALASRDPRGSRGHSS